jgi:hypothetical protein
MKTRRVGKGSFHNQMKKKNKWKQGMLKLNHHKNKWMGKGSNSLESCWNAHKFY